MGLLVLILRCYLVFQNIYVTYKTLKLPPPSSRNGGKPTIRAMTQRKRDMKGCMAIWIVWCCLAAYESAVERLISLFIPFYDEIKSVILALFILARARGAEPIYLHVIRPFLKPYVSTLDAVLDILHSVGDFAILLLLAPLRPLQAWRHFRVFDLFSFGTRSDSAVDRADPPPPYVYPAGSSAPRAGSESLEASIAKFYGGGDHSASKHEAWRPRASAYDDDWDDEVHHDTPVVMPEPSIPSFGNSNDPWRAHSSLPSDYPPAPLRPGSALMPQPSPDYLDSDRLDFHQSLLPPRELINPSSDGGLSDEIQTIGVQVQVQSSTPEHLDNDNNDHYQSDCEMEEDSFDITLRTPYALRIRPQATPPPLISREESGASILTAATVASSVESDTADSDSVLSGLSTVRHAPTLKTTTSVASSTESSTTSSALSRKRRLSSAARSTTGYAIDSDLDKNLKASHRRAVRTRPPSTKRMPSKAVASRPQNRFSISKESLPGLGRAEFTYKRRRLAASPKRTSIPGRSVSSGHVTRSTSLARKAEVPNAKAPSSRASSRISAQISNGLSAPSRLPLSTLTANSRHVKRGKEAASRSTEHGH